MSRPFDIGVPPQRAFTRQGSFAIELLDPVTLERVGEGVRVIAEGLRGTPYLNSSQLFVWLAEDVTRLQKVSINPRTLPYDALDLQPSQLNLPPSPDRVTTITLPPRVDYPFSAGVTAARGTLVEEHVPSPKTPTPVRGADVWLRWRDDDGVTWHDSPPVSRTNERGDFVAVLRLAAADLPQLDASGAVTARLHVRRTGSSERTSAGFKLPQGRVADASTLPALLFAWDELQP